MSDVAIRVQGLGKRYRLGQREPYRALRDILADALSNPFRARRREHHRPTPSRARPDTLFWALQDISFEINRGEVVGVIGRNGSGKSTLLKILARITEPTVGAAEIQGRVGSLLEVGTGFHPELSGRENIYLNGAILGMKKTEIARNFDDIVGFAEIERFLDTPVKYYSSGMYVRLAFAVAAHLQPEILFVDEVLAVGDTAFQKKCLAKMGDVATAGRTILFVSHNMQAISQLTDRCILLSDGRCQFDGPTATAVSQYLAAEQGEATNAPYYRAPPADRPNYLAAAQVHTSHADGLHRWGEPITFEFQLHVDEPLDSLCFAFQVTNGLQPACYFWHFESTASYRRHSGLYRLRCHVPKFRLFMGSYTLTTWLVDRRSNTVHESLTGICRFEVTMQGSHWEENEWTSGVGAYLEDATWSPIEREPLTQEVGSARA
jgi:ABC-type polysaccharide/polyol phosphate transport system ATPase subunit